MKNNALVLLWKGEKISDYLVKKIAEVLTTNGVCIPEMLTIKYMDETSVSNALIRDTDTISFVTKEDSAESIRNAVIYIGTRFKSALTNKIFGNNTALFAIELSNAVMEAKRNSSFVGVGTSDELLTAVKILSEETGTIPPDVAKKYHFTQDVVNVIKKVYNTAF